MKKSNVFVWLVAVLVALFPLAGPAQPNCTTEQPSYAELRRLDRVGCFSQDATNPLTGKVRKILATSDLGPMEDRIRDAVGVVLESLTALPSSQDSPARGSLRLLEQRIKNATTTATTKLDWELERETGVLGTSNEINLKDLLDKNCAQSRESCASAFEDARAVLAHASAMAEIVLQQDPVTWLAFQDRYRVVNEQWQKYLFEARAQYFWELVLNSKLFDKQRRKEESFPSPPDYQWILLHPGVALEYVDGAPAGNRFEPVVVIEWVGFNTWNWAGSRMDRPLGVSAVTTYGDRAGMKSAGYGLLFHYKHVYSLGITTRDGEKGVFLSFDLAKLWTEKTDRLEEAREQFKLPKAAFGQ